MPGRRSNSKGSRGQREAAAAWTAATGLPARNGAQRGQVAGMDVEQPAAVRLEVKRAERLHLPAWCKQAEQDADGLPWAVLHRRNGEPWRCTLDLEQLLPFAAAILDAQRQLPPGGVE